MGIRAERVSCTPEAEEGAMWWKQEQEVENCGTM